MFAKRSLQRFVADHLAAKDVAFVHVRLSIKTARKPETEKRGAMSACERNLLTNK